MDILQRLKTRAFAEQSSDLDIHDAWTEIERLREGLLEALEWNWLADDYPENTYFELAQLAQPEKDAAEIWADISPQSTKQGTIT